MYDVMDIARFIINYSNEHGIPNSNLKLQKLLYFVQAYYLGISKEHEPCFLEDFQAWDFGPVIPEVYREYRNNGSSNIPPINSYIKTSSNIFDSKRVSCNESQINEEDRINISKIVDLFSEHSATQLVNITHNQRPWKNAYVAGKNNIISKKAIKEYFYK